MTLVGGAAIGKYVVRRKLAEGGMAEVYLASSTGAEGFEKEVAIKRIRAFLASDPGFVEMFIAEARLASKLNHANLVQIFDFDKHEDTYYLAMEYVHGHSLWETRKRSKELMQPIPPTLVAHIGAEVARGLSYAHRLTDKGKPLHLVHRDVTPHNVLLSFDGSVKLTDFGVAKAGNSQTAAGVLKGKFAYMSPEQSRGEKVDARTDVFALGIVLWEMLTAARLFDGDSDVAVLRAVQERKIPPPARLNPDVPADLDEIVMRALDRDLTTRIPAASELERLLAESVLRNAKTLLERDVGAYLRRLFPEEAEPEQAAAAQSSASASPKPGTAVMPGMTPSRAPAVSPDEDVNAPTHVVDRPRGPPTLSLPVPPSSAAAPVRAEASQPAPAPPVTTPPQPAATESLPQARRRGGLFAGAAVLVAVVGIGAAAAVVSARAGQGRGTATAPAPEETVATEPPPVPEAAPASEPPRSGELAADAVAPAERPPELPSGAGEEPKAPASQAPPAAQRVEAVASKAEPELRPQIQPAVIEIRVRPYAAVFIDDRRYAREVAGVRRFSVPPGKRKVRLRHPLGEKTFDLELAPGEKVRLNHAFVR